MLPNAQFHASQVPVYIGKIMEKCERGLTWKYAVWKKGRWWLWKVIFFPNTNKQLWQERLKNILQHFPILYCLTKTEVSDLSNGMFGLFKEGRHFKYSNSNSNIQIQILISTALFSTPCTQFCRVRKCDNFILTATECLSNVIFPKWN